MRAAAEGESRRLLAPLRRQSLKFLGRASNPLRYFVGAIRKCHNLNAYPRAKAQTDDSWSVPYSHNLGLMICRQDVLQELRAPDIPIADTLYKVAEELWGGDVASGWRGWLRNRAMFLQQWINDPTAGPPEVLLWEEIIALCRLAQARCLLETRMRETLTITFLEMFWACLPGLERAYDYDRKNWRDGIERSLRICDLLFATGDQGAPIVPLDSCLEPEYLQDLTIGGAAGKWLFARQWYSTLVDSLTAQRETTEHEVRHVWRPNGDSEGRVVLHALATPTTCWAFRKLSTQGIELNGEKLDKELAKASRSCAGEWHLCVVAGSENRALAYDLIENLMTRARTEERAARGADLPTANWFYRMHRNEACFAWNRRSDVVITPRSYDWIWARLKRCLPRYGNELGVEGYDDLKETVLAALNELRTRPAGGRRELAKMVKAIKDRLRARRA